MTLATSIRIVLIFMLSLAIYFAAGNAIAGNTTPGTDWFGLSIIFYVVALLLLSYVKVNRVQPLIIYFIFLSIFWCVFRIIVLYNSMESVNYRYLVDFDSGDMTWTIFMINMSSIFLVCGIVLGGYKGPPKVRLKVPMISSAVNIKFFIAYFLFLMFFALIENNLFRASGVDKWLAIVGMLLSTDSLIFLVCALLICRQNISKRHKYLLVFTLFAYVLLRVFFGSKSGIYVVFLGLLTCILAFNHRYRLNFKHVISIAFIAPFALAFFVIGTETRAMSYVLSNANNFSNFSLIISK